MRLVERNVGLAALLFANTAESAVFCDHQYNNLYNEFSRRIELYGGSRVDSHGR